jgi:hypothetical protein
LVRKVVESLEKNQEANYIPFIFVLDGGPNATQQEHIDIINASSIKHKFIYAHITNYGCGRTLIDARRFMFEWCKFKKIFFFEDDMIVSPQYIALTLNLYSDAKKKYNNIGVVQSYNKCFLSEETKRLYYDYIIEPFGGFWGYLMDKDAYFAIADLMNEHEQKHLIAIPANQPNGPAIAKWIKDKILCNPSLNRKNDLQSFKSRIDWKKFCGDFINELQERRSHRDGQDFEMRLALWKNNLVRLTTFVSRGLYIGKEGVHHNGNYYQKFAYDQLVPFALQNDSCFAEFKESFHIGTGKIIFDCENFQCNTISYYLDCLIENGYNIKIFTNKKDNYVSLYHYLPSFVNNNFFLKNKKYIKITPIQDKEALKNFLLDYVENKCEYLYIIDSEMVNFNQLYFKMLINNNIYFIAHDKKVKNKLLSIFDKSRIFMWYDTFKLFEQYV